MYGAFITPPDDPSAHFGVLFWHKDGFSTAYGHETIALGHRAVANGIVKRDPPGCESLDAVIDLSSGQVVARVAFDDAGDVLHVDFINVASRQLSAGHELTVRSVAFRVCNALFLQPINATQRGVEMHSKDRRPSAVLEASEFLVLVHSSCCLQQ